MVDQIDNDLIEDSTLLDPNLEPPLPAITSHIEPAPVGSLFKESTPAVVIESDIRRDQSEADEFQPPPTSEYEPTIELEELNYGAHDVAHKLIIPKSFADKEPVTQQKETEKSKPVATDAIQWTELSYDLGLQGFAQAIATNSVVGKYEQNHLQLFLTSDFMKFVNPENQDEICQAIASKLGLSLILDLHVQDKLDAETPSETRLRKQHEHRQMAIDSIKQELTVKKLQREFGAELIESSVQLMDEK
ncbi:MAG: hypothetical protein ACI9CO_000407 [Candidatus Azotimanducaceae bacterium]